MVFPDKNFQQKVTTVPLLATCFVLLLYWGIGFLMMSGYADNNPSPERIFFCIFIYTIGLILMVLTDMQKYITLMYKKGLIDNYFLSNNRNTNYFGEMLLYGSFAILVNHILALYLLLFVWLTIFVSRIYLKEQSLIKKDGYQK
jgi:protein-S-isoprenylcysteine O-methyltransferase Ste14